MNRSQHNINHAVLNLLRLSGISIPGNRVHNTLIYHPDYPSILSLSESLLEWGVETEAVQGTISELSEADYPSIAHLKTNQYVVVESIRDGNVALIVSNKKRKTVSLGDFDEMWSGVLLRVLNVEKAFSTADQSSDNKNNKDNILLRRSRKWVFSALALLVLAAFFYSIADSPVLNVLVPLGILKIMGMTVCFALFFGQYGKSHVLSKVCPVGKISNCQRVIESSAGKLFGIPMSDLGIVYFSGGFLALFLSSLSGQPGTCLLLLGILNLFTLPYTVFSVAYQAFIVRSWCWLCLVIQALFWIEFALMFKFVFNPHFAHNWESFFLSLFGFGVTILSWILFRPVITRFPRLEKMEIEFARLRKQPKFIRFKLASAPKLDLEHFPVEIEIGKRDASITLMQVINPLCTHCGHTLKEMLQLIDLDSQKIKGIVRFLGVTGHNEHSEFERRLDYVVAQTVAAMAVEERKEELRDALTDWFFGDWNNIRRHFDVWQRKYGPGDESAKKQADKILALHRQWALDCDIHSTPALLMNRLRLPLSIEFSDLKYFLLRLPAK